MCTSEFRDSLSQVHGPLFDQLPCLGRFVRNFPLPDPARKPPGWDAVVELSFDSWPAMEAAWASPQGERATEDFSALADLMRRTRVVVGEGGVFFGNCAWFLSILAFGCLPR